VIFACLLVASLVVKKRSGDMLEESGDLEPAIIRLAQSNGLVFRGYEDVAAAEVRALAFDAPGCTQPVFVAKVEDTFEQGLTLQLAGVPGNVRRYVYIDRSWPIPDRPGVFGERAKQMILAVLGMTRYVPSRRLLLIDSPPGCHAADAIDWRPVWDRDYLAAAQGDPKAAEK
jgi:hypothetical protein